MRPGPIEAVFQEVQRLVAVNAVHRRHGPIATFSRSDILEHIRAELRELTNEPGDINEAADVMCALLHFVERQGWTLDQLSDAALNKLALRFRG